jgi:hypothetical protein
MAVSQNKIVSSQAVRSRSALATVAKTTFTDAANAVLLATSDATNGGVVYGITAIARATITASKLQIYRSSDGGTTLILIRTRLMAAYTMSNTDSQSEVDFGWTESVPLRLQAGDSLYCAAAVVPAAAAGVAFDCQYENL